MPRILVCAALRDMQQHPNWDVFDVSPLEAFLTQLEQQEQLGYEFSYSFYENDSRDATPEVLAGWTDRRVGEGKRVTFIAEKLGRKRYRSLPADKGQERIKLYAEVRNRTLEAYDGEDWVLFVEPDILYRPDTLGYLLSSGPGDIRSPLSFSSPHSLLAFYDPLSTRDIDGKKFQWAWPPTNRQEDHQKVITGTPFEVSSTWNCFCLISGEVIKAGVRFSGDTVGESEASSFCRDAREKGFKVYVFPSIRYSTVHPLANHAWSENDE